MAGYAEAKFLVVVQAKNRLLLDRHLLDKKPNTFMFVAISVLAVIVYRRQLFLTGALTRSPHLYGYPANRTPEESLYLRNASRLPV